MGTLRKAAGSAVVLVFLFMLVLRPLLANPALASVGFDEVFSWPEVLLYAPLLVVVVGIFVLGALALLRGDGLPTGRDAEPAAGRRDVAPETGEEDSVDEETLERFEHHPDLSSRFLGGKGGARNRGPDIEDGTPDAALDEHLEHLRTELGDDPHAREELRTLEDVVSETDSEQVVPARCPQEHCDALWTERTMFDVTTGRYELLDDGQRVQCLECESIHSLERRE